MLILINYLVYCMPHVITGDYMSKESIAIQRSRLITGRKSAVDMDDRDDRFLSDVARANFRFGYGDTSPVN
jgi:hypothetical protein